MNSSRSYKVVSCSGITDPDLPGKEKCPFYDGEFICVLDGHIIENPLTIPITVIPEDCLLRRFNIAVETDVLSQPELPMDHYLNQIGQKGKDYKVIPDSYYKH